MATSATLLLVILASLLLVEQLSSYCERLLSVGLSVKFQLYQIFKILKLGFQRSFYLSMLSSDPDAIDHSGHLYVKNHICENLFPSWIHGHKFLHIYIRLFFICIVIIYQYVSKLHTKLRKVHTVHQLQVEIGELKGRLTEVVSNCDSLCKRIMVEGPESLHSSVKPFTRLSSMSKDPPLPL